MPPVVNSWNEWDPLEEVIVGTARGAAEIAYEPALAPYYQSGAPGHESTGGAVLPHLIDEAERQLDDFANVLARRGIASGDAGVRGVPRKPLWPIHGARDEL